MATAQSFAFRIRLLYRGARQAARLAIRARRLIAATLDGMPLRLCHLGTAPSSVRRLLAAVIPEAVWPSRAPLVRSPVQQQYWENCRVMLGDTR